MWALVSVSTEFVAARAEDSVNAPMPGSANKATATFLKPVGGASTATALPATAATVKVNGTAAKKSDGNISNRADRSVVEAVGAKLIAASTPVSSEGLANSAEPQTSPVSTAATSMQLTPEVREVAVIIEMLPVLEQLEKEQSMLGDAPVHSIERIEKNQHLLYLRQKLIQGFETAMFEINSTRGKIDMASADLADAEAVLNEHRARTIRRNSMINFVSGGVTKMVGYGLALADVNPITTNVLEVMDGGIQSTLSGFTIADQRAEKQMLKGVPTFLSDLIVEPKIPDREYPKSVWMYLNSVPPGSQKQMTRRELLIANWKRNGILNLQPKAVRNANGQLVVNAAIEGKWLDDHSAMLSDLKSVISRMNEGLMVLSQLVKHTYSVGPEF